MYGAVVNEPHCRSQVHYWSRHHAKAYKHVSQLTKPLSVAKFGGEYAGTINTRPLDYCFCLLIRSNVYMFVELDPQSPEAHPELTSRSYSYCL